MGKKNKTESKQLSENSEESTSNESEEVNSQTHDDDSVLKEKVTSYLKIDDLIKEKKEDIKELTKKKLKYEEFLMEYLEKINKTRIETKDGEIVYKKQTSKAPLKEELIEKAIVKKFQDVKNIKESGIKIAHDVLEEVNSMRGVNIKNNIRRIKKKTTKSSPKSS
jgi:hypothetical protein